MIEAVNQTAAQADVTSRLDVWTSGGHLDMRTERGRGASL